MVNRVNQPHPFIYQRSTGKKVPVTEAEHDAYYADASRIRNKEQNHGRCMCPKQFIWKCEGDCLDCEFHATGDLTSLDIPTGDGKSNIYDFVPDSRPSMESIIADRDLLDRLFKRLRELDPDADAIIAMWQENTGISDKAIAKALGRPQRTFADQMKRYRTELRKLRGY